MRAPLPLLALPFALACSGACAEYDLAAERNDGDVFDGEDDTALADQRLLRLDVYPDGLGDPERGVRYLPQTFTPTDIEADLTLDLRPAVVLEGDVVAWQVTPWADADLPGTQEPVGGAVVSVWDLGTVQAANGTTSLGGASEDGDAAPGSFAIDVVPGADYQVAVVPADPTIPFTTTQLSLLADTALTFDLGYGAAVWGTVVDGTGKGMKGVGVYAINEAGVAGASAFTDDTGRYLLRVEPGQGYRIVAEGRGNGREPQIEQGPVLVDGNGAEVAFVYPNTIGSSASGRIVDADARPIENVEVAFQAITLDGYPSATTFTDTVVTNANGYFDTTRLLPGTYSMEVRPRAQHELTPTVQEIVVDGEFEELGTITLASLVSVGGIVVDESDAPVPGAVLVLTEVGYGGRIWQAAVDETGQFFVSLPRVPLEVTVTPPHDRGDLAISRYLLDPNADDLGSPTLVVREGTRIQGTVQTPDGPAEYVVVEARDEQGRRWGTALTDARGEYEMQVLLTP